MLYAKQLTPQEQIFSHNDLQGKEYHIAADRLRYKLRDKALTTVQIEAEIAQRLVTLAGIEKHRVDVLLRLTDEQFDKLLPPLILWFKNETWVFADGNHQYVAAHLRLRRSIQCVVASRQEWSPFIIKDYKANYFDFSGITKSPAVA